MPLPLNIGDEFLDLFYHDIKEFKLDGSNKLNLFTLKVVNNAFAYNELIELLGDKLYYFSLSRNEIKKLKDSDSLNTLIKRSKDKLKDHLKNGNDSNSEGGELGEILLYCLLESHLKAPKILTKLELKTSRQLYVNGADGVHLLKLNNKDYQLVFGESKLHSDLSQAIYKSFASIEKLIKEKGEKRDFEINLINSQLIKEAYDENMYLSLKKVIIPSAKVDETNMDYSFGIFLGFNINITAEEKKKENSIFRSEIREKIKKEIEGCIASINKQINKNHFTGYNFYVYIIPFSDLPEQRIELIEGLL